MNIWEFLKDKEKEKLGIQPGGGGGTTALVEESQKEVFDLSKYLIPKGEVKAGVEAKAEGGIKLEEPKKEEPNIFDTLNESIEKNYKQYQSLTKKLEAYQAEYDYAPESIKPSLAANYNKLANQNNELAKQLKIDILKRDQIITTTNKTNFMRYKQATGLPTTTIYEPTAPAPIIEGLPISKPEEKPKPLFQDQEMIDLEKTNFTMKQLWFKELKESKNKMSFLKGEEHSPELIEIQKKYNELAPYTYAKSEKWISATAAVGYGIGTIWEIANALATTGFKVKDKLISKEELEQVMKDAAKVVDPETGNLPASFPNNDYTIIRAINTYFKAGGGRRLVSEGWEDTTGTFHPPIFESVKGDMGLLGRIIEQTGGLKIPQTVNIFGGTLRIGMLPEDITKSFIATQQLTQEMIQSLDPAKTAQVTQQLLNTSPALANIFLEAVGKPKVSPAKQEPTVKEKLYAEKYNIPLEKVKVTELPKGEELKEEIVTEGTINKLEELIGKKTTPEEVKAKIKAGIKAKGEVKAEIPTEKVAGVGEVVYRASEKPYNAELAGEEGIFVWKNKTRAVNWAKTQKYPNVEEFIISKDANILRQSDIPKVYTKTVNGITIVDDQIGLIRYAKEKGYDGIEDEGEYAIWNKSKITKTTPTEKVAGVEEVTEPVKSVEEKIEKPISKELKNDYLKIIGKDIKLAKDRVELIRNIRKDTPISGELQIKYPDLMKKIPEAKFVEIGVEPVKPEDIYTKGEKIIPSKIKPLVREVTGQIPKRIEVAERDILKYAMQGQVKLAKQVFREAKKEGIFEQKERFTEVVARAREREFKRDEINKVKDILKNTDLNKLRPERQSAIKKIITDIDLARMTERTERKLTSRLDFIKDNPDNQIPQGKIEELERLTKKPISDFTVEDITLVKNAILHEINLNKLKNKLIFGREIKEAVEVLKIARENVLKGKAIKKDSGNIIDSSITEHETFGQRIKRLWKLDSWTPETICEELDCKDHGEIMDYVYSGIDKGVTGKLRIEQEVDDWFWDQLKGIKIDNWSKVFQVHKKDIDFQSIKLSGYKLPTGETIGNRTIKITKGERISFLLHEKNEKNLKHLLEGGFRFGDNLSKKYNLSEDNLDEIINSATPEEVKVADVMWKFFNEIIKPKLNEISLELNGWEVAIEDNYYPIKTVELDRQRDALKAKRTFTNKTLEGMGIFKERINARNALIIEDAFSAVTKHLEQTSSYIGLAKPLRYAKLLLEDTELQENIRQVYGKEYVNNLKDYLERIEGDSTNLENVDVITVELINKLDSAILGAHIFVAFKQPLSYLTANSEIEGKYLKKGLGIKIDYEEIKKNSPQLRERMEGNINREMGELGNVGRAKQLFLHKSPLNTKLLSLLRKSDSLAIGKIWNAVKLEIKDKFPDLTQEEFMNKVTERAEEITRRTQSTAHVKDRSSIGRTKNILIRLWTKYTSERNKNVNILKRATLRYNRSKHTAGDKIKLVKIFAIVLIVNSLMVEAINELRKRAYGNKSRTVWEFAIDTLATCLSNFYFIGDTFGSLVSKIKSGTYSGYDTGNLIETYLNNAINGLVESAITIEQLKTKEKYKSGDKKGEEKWKTSIIRAADKNISTILTTEGLPYDNVKRLVSGIWKMAGEKKEEEESKIKALEGYGKKYISKPSGYGKEVITGKPKGYGD